MWRRKDENGFHAPKGETIQVERIASNEMIANKFQAAGFTDVKVTGEGGTRYAEGVWNQDNTRPTYPAQISDIAEVVA